MPKEKNDPEAFIKKAKVLAAENFNQYYDEILGTNDWFLRPEPKQFYVVWFAKTLQNWKALISTDLVDDRYWEVTYNGDKKETYVDQYKKANNASYTDEWFDALP
jgi:hypothetical protein